MFGYIIANKGELKFREFDVYHSYYCGLCRELKEACGIRGQITLNYDMAFLALLLTGLYEPKTKAEMEKCTVRPLKRQEARRNLCTSYAADMNLLLAYYQCRDDWKDDKKLTKYALYRLLSGYYRELQEKYPQKVSAIETNMKRLYQGERKNCQNIDKMAGYFGNVLGEVFAWKKDEWEEALRRIGFYLGKFVYLCDAYEDIEEDEKSGNFNPLRDLQEKGNFEEECQQILTMMMAECCREFEKLPVIENVSILRNILYSGVWSRYSMVKKKKLQKAVQK